MLALFIKNTPEIFQLHTEWFGDKLQAQIYQEISLPHFSQQPHIDQQKELIEPNKFFEGDQKIHSLFGSGSIFLGGTPSTSLIKRLRSFN